MGSPVRQGSFKMGFRKITRAEIANEGRAAIKNYSKDTSWMTISLA
jgi:hypothetical protein